MNIFGLTPIDSHLAAWGLNCSSHLIELFFFKTPIGLLAFMAGFLWSIWESSKNANFKYFAIFVFISLTVSLLLILPQRQVPIITSAQEIYGTGVNLTAQSLEEDQEGNLRVPLILSYFSQMIDSISFSVIHGVDVSVNNNFSFINHPFYMDKLSLQAYQMINSPINDLDLRKDLDDFMYAYYLPSLIMYRNETRHLPDIYSLWPGNKEILKSYPEEGRSQWLKIQDQLDRLIDSPELPWKAIQGILDPNNSKEDFKDQVMASIIHGQYSHRKDVWLKWAGSMPILFPYLYGWASACLYVAFPFGMLALIIIRRMSFFFHYMEIFVWIKSWIISSALSFYISLCVVRVQTQMSGTSMWFWDHPYYLAITSILLIIMPLMTFIGIRHSFNCLSNRV